MYTPGIKSLASLTGAELVDMDAGGAIPVRTTASLIAALGRTSATFTATAITTVGDGTLTAAALVGGEVLRSGPTAAFTDTTATAAQIVAALPSFISGSSFLVLIKNTTLFPMALSAGTNVTLPTTTLVGPFSLAAYIAVIGGTAAVPTVTLTHLDTTTVYNSNIYRCTTAQTANANVVPAAITGLSGAVAVGTYRFRAAIYTTVASGTGGIAINQVLTTAVLGVCNFVAIGAVAAGVATQATTTATSGTALYTAAAQPLLIIIEGTFTVTTAGTIGLQMCQNTSNASNSVVNVGSYMELTRIA